MTGAAKPITCDAARIEKALAEAIVQGGVATSEEPAAAPGAGTGGFKAPSMR